MAYELSSKQVCKRLGISHGKLMRWRSAGAPVQKPKHALRWDLDLLISWARKEGHLEPEPQPAEPEDISEREAKRRKVAAQARKARIEAEAAELEARVRAGELVEKKQAEAAMGKEIVRARNALLSMAARHADEWCAITEHGEMMTAVERAVKECLQGLSDGL